MLSREVVTLINDDLEPIIGDLTFRGEVFAETDGIIHAVAYHTDMEIYFKYASFSKFLPEYADSGAVMCVMEGANGVHRAHIVLNQDKDLKFRRFSLVHELAHLITGEYVLAEKEDQYMICSHIQYDIRPFVEGHCQNDSFVIAEELCNVVALKILLPADKFAKKMFELKDISEVAKCFGVTEDAVCSRMLLGW